MADAAISYPNDYENLHGWKELEKSIKIMQEYHPAPTNEPQLHGSETNGSSDGIPDNEEEVMRTVMEDGCIKQMMKFFKEQIASAMYERAPASVKKYLQSEEHKFTEPNENLNKEENHEKGFWEKLWNTVKNFFNQLKEALESFWNKILDILKKVIEFVKRSIISLFDRVGEMLMNFYTNAEEVAEKSVKIVSELLLNQIEEVLKSYAVAFMHGIAI